MKIIFYIQNPNKLLFIMNPQPITLNNTTIQCIIKHFEFILKKKINSSEELYQIMDKINIKFIGFNEDMTKMDLGYILKPNTPDPFKSIKYMTLHNIYPTDPVMYILDSKINYEIRKHKLYYTKNMDMSYKYQFLKYVWTP